jgi:hypothetical protein
MKLICTFSIDNYTHEDFAEAEFDDIAYYNDDDELIEVRPITQDDIYNLWLYLGEENGGWDGELTGWEIKK